MSQEYEYTTTWGRFYEGQGSDDPELPAPCPPLGKGWRLIDTTSVGERGTTVLFFWERVKPHVEGYRGHRT